LTGDPVLRRLSMLAALFSGPSRSFLREVREAPYRLAVDIGCGTGHSTRLVAAELEPQRTVGLDSSAAALSAARSRTRRAGIEYIEHDVTSTPFPPGTPDVVYSRFVLAHVPDPIAVVERWASELAPGGTLLLDEGTSIETAHEPIGRYLEMLGALQHHRGTAVDISGLLDELAGRPDLRRTFIRERRFSPPARDVAAMLRANMDAWVDDPFITAHVGPAAVGWVQAELERLAATDVREGVAWGLKQVALSRDGVP
jgi:trans-aconitate 2-methyltransferase